MEWSYRNLHTCDLNIKLKDTYIFDKNSEYLTIEYVLNFLR